MFFSTHYLFFGEMKRGNKLNLKRKQIEEVFDNKDIKTEK